MKITICGSIKFADKLVQTYRELEKLGHQPQMHEDMFGIANGTAKQLKENGEHADIKRKYNYIKIWHNLIVNSDAILVCNYDKNGIKNYIGGNTLMEMGFAHVHDKKVFLLNPIPDMPYSDEIKAMTDIILYGDLTKII
jgi:hypothetical protein